MSDKNLLNIKDLYVDVEDKEILHGVNLSIGKGETHVLMGPRLLQWALLRLFWHCTVSFVPAAV